jgi:hypothetical protein
MAMMTQGRLDSFAVQVATNYYECELFKLAYRNVKQLCVITKKHDYENVETTDERQSYPHEGTVKRYPFVHILYGPHVERHKF